MASYQVLNDDIVCIDTEQLRPGMAACYLVGDGAHHALIECGTSLSVPAVLQVLAERGVAREAVDYVIPTHVHLDHAGGAGALLRELPRARLVVHPRGARHLIDPSRLIAGATAVYGADFMRRSYGEIVPIAEQRVIVAEVAPGRDFTLALGQRMLRFIDAQGHARHHFTIWDERSGGWFTGDTFGTSYREFDHAGRSYILPTTTPVQFDPPAWQASLDRMLETAPRYMYLTHYGRVDDVPRLAGELRASLDAYVGMARAADGRPDRGAWLRQQLLAYHLDELRERQHPMAEALMRTLLAPDVEVNAQGLEDWLDRMRARAASGVQG
jgi:glyoxylase-like metal-dependent hydrolase (beta-lactamase superfamily II)